MIEDLQDRRIASSAVGLLAEFNRAEVLHAADVHVALRFGALVGESDEQVQLALALAVRAARMGSVCVDLATVAAVVVADSARSDALTELGAAPPLPWPTTDDWLARVAASPLTAQRVVRLEGTLLYLDRYWREEVQVCTDLVTRLQRPEFVPDEARLAVGLDRVFPPDGDKDFTEQRAAVDAGVRRTTIVLTGGPGTGKTTAVAGLLALVAEQSSGAVRIALCAPTGKAAARLQEAVDEEVGRLPDDDRARVSGLTATTMHRLLGWRPDSSVRFRHDRSNRLPHDLVVVDESSMVSLTMMARLLEALRPDCRLVLVGDPDQLSSVEAGAVLADLVEGVAGVEDPPLAPLRTNHRSRPAIRELAERLREGDADAVMAVLRSGAPEVELVDPDDAAAMAGFESEVVDVASRMRVAADAGDVGRALACLAEHRLLCAHRQGPFGVSGWNARIERGVAERTGVTSYDEWHPGRPVLVTANDRGQRLANGDMGVTVRLPDGRLRVVLAEPGQRLFAPTRLPDVQTVHAMTVHKSQGSQAWVVSVVMPPEESRLLSRELFYTAVTRAQERVRVVGTEAAIRAAVGREVQRASGLDARLRAALSAGS